MPFFGRPGPGGRFQAQDTRPLSELDRVKLVATGAYSDSLYFLGAFVFGTLLEVTADSVVLQNPDDPTKTAVLTGEDFTATAEPDGTVTYSGTLTDIAYFDGETEVATLTGLDLEGTSSRRRSRTTMRTRSLPPLCAGSRGRRRPTTSLAASTAMS